MVMHARRDTRHGRRRRLRQQIGLFAAPRAANEATVGLVPVAVHRRGVYRCHSRRGAHGQGGGGVETARLDDGLGLGTLDRHPHVAGGGVVPYLGANGCRPDTRVAGHAGCPPGYSGGVAGRRVVADGGQIGERPVEHGFGQRGGGRARRVDVHVYERPVARVDGAGGRPRGGARPRQVRLGGKTAPGRAGDRARLGDAHGGEIGRGLALWVREPEVFRASPGGCGRGGAGP